MEGENTAAQEDMRGLGTRDSTADWRADTLEGTRREQSDEEDGEEGAPRRSEKDDDGSGTATGSRQRNHATSEDPQRHDGGQAGKAEDVKAGYKAIKEEQGEG